jgi:endo-beta-N-acetylglucosaminidase D
MYTVADGALATSFNAGAGKTFYLHGKVMHVHLAQ